MTCPMIERWSQKPQTSLLFVHSETPDVVKVKARRGRQTFVKQWGEGARAAPQRWHPQLCQGSPRTPGILEFLPSVVFLWLRDSGQGAMWKIKRKCRLCSDNQNGCQHPAMGDANREQNIHTRQEIPGKISLRSILEKLQGDWTGTLQCLKELQERWREVLDKGLGGQDKGEWLQMNRGWG